MLHRTVWTFRTLQRAALRQSSARQHGHVHGLSSQPRPLLIITRSLHDDSNIPPSSQDPSHDPSYTPSSHSWAVDKINVLQTDVATNKMQLDHLKESMDTKISNLQNNVESSITRSNNALESRMNLKFDTLESKMNSKFDTLEFKMNSKFGTLEKDIKHVVVELTAEFKAELAKNVAELKADMGKHEAAMGKHEARLIWRMFFAVLGISALAVSGAVTTFSTRPVSSTADSSCREEMKQDGDRSLFMRDRFLPQQTPRVGEK